MWISKKRLEALEAQVRSLSGREQYLSEAIKNIRFHKASDPDPNLRIARILDHLGLDEHIVPSTPVTVILKKKVRRAK